MTRRIIAIGIALFVFPSLSLSTASADEVSDEPITIPVKKAPPPPPPAVEEPVTAPMPASISMTSTSLGAGVGILWGEGTLHLDGENHGFAIRGRGIGDLGYATIESFDSVSHVEDASDIAGTYVAVEAGAATGSGAGAVTMRNESGVVVTLHSERRGAQIALGADVLRVDLK